MVNLQGRIPAPPGTAKRRNTPTANLKRLPSARTGPTPKWPRDSDEPDIWAEVWTFGQAVEWEKMRCHRIVARYCEILEQLEEAPTAKMNGEARQLEDRLGLTPQSLLRLRWEIVEDDEPEPQPEVVKKERARITATD